MTKLNGQSCRHNVHFEQIRTASGQDESNEHRLLYLPEKRIVSLPFFIIH